MESSEREPAPLVAWLCAGGTWLLVAAGLGEFLRGVVEARRVILVEIHLFHGATRIEDNPWTYNAAVLLIVAGAALAIGALAGLAIYRGRLRLGRRLAGGAGAVLVLLTLVSLVSHSLLYPCYDDGALYNCSAFLGGDSVSGASGLFAAAMVLCFGVAIWLDSREVRALYGHSIFWSGPRY